MHTLDAKGKRIYTLKKVQAGEVTKSAHPARFSPDDKYSRYERLPFRGKLYRIHCEWGLTKGRRHRVTLKKRYGLLLTQQSERPTGSTRI